MKPQISHILEKTGALRACLSHVLPAVNGLPRVLNGRKERN